MALHKLEALFTSRLATLSRDGTLKGQERIITGIQPPQAVLLPWPSCEAANGPQW